MNVTFREIKDSMRQRIQAGNWAPGDLLPNEVDLAAEFDCARATVNRAMRELAEEGLIERRRKTGTRVRPSPVRQARFEIPLVRKEIEGRGARYLYTLVHKVETPAPDWLRARLALAGNTPVLHLLCLHSADSQPYQFEDRWINLAALPQAATADFASLGPNEWLVETVPYTDAEISFSATPADPQAARHLGCGEGDALFQVERTTWWQDRPITYVRLLFQRGHRMTTRY